VSRRPGGAPRVALFGELGIDNLGNDASAAVVLGLLREVAPDAEVAVVSRDPEGAARAFGLPTHPAHAPRRPGARSTRAAALADRVRDAVHLFRLARRFDVIVVPGAGVLEAAGSSPGGTVLSLCVVGLGARSARARYVWVCVGGGRYRSRRVRAWVAVAARLASVRTFRDEMTRAQVAACGVDTLGDVVLGDVVTLTGPYRALDGADGTVVVSPIDVPARGRGPQEAAAARATYLDELVELTRRLLAEGRDVRVVVADGADVATADALVERVLRATGRRVEQRRPTTFADLLDAVAGTTAVVSSRYHVLLAGALAGRPLVALSHADKDDALLADVGLADAVVPIEEATADAVRARLATALADPRATAARLDRWARESAASTRRGAGAAIVPAGSRPPVPEEVSP